MTCACGHENPEEAKFCLECGSPLAHRCAECATVLPAGAKFCLECGHPVATVPGATADAESRHEVRKVVTVVFVDLAGSTSLQEHMDPESVRRVMDRFYTQMRTEIEGAGGVVVKFTGDGVMAGFGIREAGEDDALHAVHAATRMQEAFAGFAEEIAAERGADVALRVGVNTGEVVVSGNDDDVVGDVVNVAARLEHAAGDGNVLVGEETRRLTRHAVTYEPVAPLELKGKAEPVPAYRLVSLEAPPEEEAAPFVGRTAELARLREVFEASVASAAPGIVTVVGSPGLGKTRLAAELAATVSDRARILEARCYAAATATYAPIAEALREAAGIPETASAEEVVAALEALLPADFPERSRIAKLTASVLGVGEAAAPQETFWATRRLLEGLTAVQPLVFIVDDVQWAEPMLLDLFDHIVEWAKGASIVIVALARPEIREVRPSLVDAGAIVLEGLDPDDTAALAASLLGAHDLPEALVRRILEATEGNPLFVRELLRMLVDDGVLSRDGDRWTITVEASEIDVPPTIHALLAARIERLQDDERAVMERASVVGKEFYRGAVLELVPPRVGTGIDAHLETLRRKELVEPEGTYWIDERVFRFHHVLIRDAAYRRLLKEARAELHERFADWLEAKVGELVGEHEEVLGYHLEQAHTYRAELGSTDDHTADLGRRAATHLASATARALDRDDLTAAANLSGRALALTDDEDARARILLDRCEALLGMGQVGAATGTVTELRALAADDRLAAWADCFDGQLAVLTDPSRLHDTAAAVEAAAGRLAELGDVAGAAKAHATHAQALAHLGQFGACEAALDRALAAAREAGDRRRANGVLASAPLAALWGPSPVPRASGRCLDVVRVLRITAGAPAVEATALRCQAVLEAMRGRTEAAHRMLASSRGTLEELGLRHALVECDLFGGLIDLFAGDVPAAEASFRAAHEGFRALNIGTDTAQAAALLARTLVEQGQDEEALALTEESERLGGDDLKTAIAWRCVRARILARRGEHEAAIDLARAAVALAEPTDALIDHADALLALAEVLSAAGREEEARAGSRKGAELLARKEARVAEQARSAEPPAALERGRVRIAPGVDPNGWDDLYNSLFAAYVRRDWKAVEAHVVPDYTVSNQQSGLRVEITSGAEYVEYVRAIYERENEWTVDLLGVNGDRSLARLRAFGPGDDATGPWEVFRVLVAERNSDGLFVRSDWFDEADMDRARDLLGGESPHEPLRGVRAVPGVSAVETVALLDRYRRVLLARDWDGMTQLYSEELVVIDHRSGLRAETVGRRAWVDAMQATWQDVESEWDFEVLGEWPEGVALSRVRSRGPGWERDYLMLTAISDGLCSRTEIFDADGHISALARLDELAYERCAVKAAIDAYVSAPNEHGWTEVDPIVGSGTAALVRVDGAFAVMIATEGRVTEVELFDDEFDARMRLYGLAPSPSHVWWLNQRYIEAHNALDWDGMRRNNAPDYELVDQRPVGWGRVSMDRQIEYFVEAASTMRSFSVAVEEWLCLTATSCAYVNKWSGVTKDGVDFSYPRIVTLEIGPSGLTTRAMTFELDQIDEARRLMAGEAPRGAAPPGGVRAAPGVEAERSVATWARLRNALLGRDAEAIRTLHAPDHAYVDHRSGLRSEAEGASAFLEGGLAARRAASAASSSLVSVDIDIEVVAAWSEDVTLARGRRFGDGWESTSLTVKVTDPDGVWVRTELFDEDDYASAFSRLDELSYEHSPIKPAIERHASTSDELERSALVPIAASGDAALVRSGESLAVVQTADGRVTEVELFDPDDELGARRRLHELAPSSSYVSWLIRCHFDRHAHQDWDAIRTLNAQNVLLVDHRPVGWGTVSGIDRVIEHLQEGARTASMAPGQLRITQWLAITPDCALHRYRWAGASPDGVDFAFDRLLLMRIRAGDGLIVRAYMYDPDQIDDGRRLMAGTDISHRAAPGVVADLSILDRARAAMLARDREAMLALHTPDHVFVDHRAGLQAEVLGPTEFLEGSASTYQGLESGRRIEILAQWTPDSLLTRSTSWGDGFEIGSLVVRVTRDGAWCRTEQFDADDYTSAFARLDELSYEHSPVKQIIETYASTADELDPSRMVPIAASGDAALVRLGDRPTVVQTADGEVTEVERFDPDDELAARRLLHELAPSPSYVSWLLRHFIDRLETQDWEAVREHFAPDIEFVDHRPLSLHTVRGIDRLLEWWRNDAGTLTPAGGPTEWLAITSNSVLYRQHWTGTTVDGVTFESDRLLVGTVRGGRFVRGDTFGPDQMDEARRCMEKASLELGPVTGRYAELFNAREWDRALEVWTPGYFVIDHRPAAFARRDLPDFVEGMKAFVDLAPNIRVEVEPLYTTPSAEVAILHLRGDTREGAAFELDIGAATRVVDGLGVSAITFEPEDIEAATRWTTDQSIGFEREDFDALRAPAEHPVVAVVQRIVALGQQDDWTAVADIVREDIVYEDHRPLFRTTSRGRDVFIEAARYQLQDGGYLDVDVIEDGGPDLVLARVLKRLGTSGDSEIPLLIIYGVDAENRLAHACLFAEDDLDGARARLDALAGGGVPSVNTPPDGPFAEFGRRWQQAFEEGAGVELGALYSPAFEVTEHQHHITLDLEAHLEEMRRAAAHPDAMARVDDIVCLGARHGVSRTTFSFDRVDGSLAGASEIGGVSAVRLDDEGLCLRFEWFPADLLHRALARAEELYIEDEATGEALAGARRRLVHWRMADAHNEGDWETFAAALAPDLESVDHRTLAWATVHGRDAFIEALQAVFARSQRHVWRISEVHAIADDGCVYALPTEGIDADGGRYEQGGVVVALLTDAGASRVEVFPFDAVDEALARFEALRREPGPAPPASTVEWFDRVFACLRAGDLEGYGALWSEDVVHEEKRPLLRSVATGRQAAVDSLLHVKDLASMQVDTELIATRGDRLELRLVRYVGDDTEGGSFDVPMLQLHVMNEEGLVERASLYEPEDVRAALEELDDRYAATLSGGEAEVFRALVRATTTYTDRDWDGYRASFHDEVAVVDHRPAAWGTFSGVDQLVSVLRTFIDLVPDASVICSSIDRMADDAVVAGIHMTGTDTNGSSVEIRYYSAFTYLDGRFNRWELFPFDDRDAAIARLDELTVRETTLERTLDHYYAMLNGEVAVSEELIAPEFRIRFHRWHLELDQAGELEELHRLAAGHSIFRRGRTFSFGDRHGVVEHLISRAAGGGVGEGDSGQRMPLLGERASASWLDVGAVVARSWLSVRCAADGRLLIIEAFDEDELLEALARIEDMHLEDEASGAEAEASRHRRDLWRAFIADNEGDWETWRSLVDPDVIVVDRRAVGWGEVDTEGVQQRQETLGALTAEHTIKLKSVAINGAVVMVEAVEEGTNEQGGHFAIGRWLIQVGRKYQEHFDPEQREEAERRFRELASLARQGASPEDMRP